MAVSNDPKHMFNAPIPGASLTKTPNSAPWQNPPQFTKEMDALNYMWDKVFMDPQTLVKVVVFLKGKVSVTEITNTLLFTGVAGNKWSLDLALLMYQEVAWMIAAIAQAHKIKYTFKRVDPTYANFLVKYKDYLQEPDETPVEQTVSKVFGSLAKGEK